VARYEEGAAADHYAHAANYAEIASALAARLDTGFAGVMIL
jgi:hypothetical protein